MVHHGTEVHCIGAQAEKQYILGSSQTSPNGIRLDGAWTESCEAGLPFPNATSKQSEMSAMRYNRLTTTTNTTM
jgi:hypothetical protein